MIKAFRGLPVVAALAVIGLQASFASGHGWRVHFRSGGSIEAVSYRQQDRHILLDLGDGASFGVDLSQVLRLEPIPPGGDERQAAGGPAASAPAAAGPPAWAAPAPSAPPDPRDPAVEDLETLIARAAERHGLDRDLLAAVIAVESGYRPDAVSPKGAQGLMQLMPGTARDLAVTDAFDPAQNIDAGARYLRKLIDENGGAYWRALAAYNAGPGRVARYGGLPPYRETIQYVRRVLDHFARPRPVPGSSGAR
ncbi:MAG TPA: lytic transglycosylase domain-containing protein [Candidatus Polarisedimenticolia bacterium]|nr:lytic transglycosylase domain-containing protein [Candidatus Polarisedimenticolia bacterium]